MKQNNIRRIIGNEIVEYTVDGMFQVIGNADEINSMITPVKCNHCGQTYDLTAVKSTARFADCDMFMSPCYNTNSDTREYKGLPDFTRV